jgi:hypothetical protein
MACIFPRPGRFVKRGCADDDGHNLFELMTFDASLAPFNRTLPNGSDAAFTLELVIPRGGRRRLSRRQRDRPGRAVRTVRRGRAGDVQ